MSNSFNSQSSRKTLVILQSRLSSIRLPAKALLPIAGIPSILLAALRAANTGLNVVVATSDTHADNSIAKVLAENKIECFRGKLENVLGRFADASAHLEDEDLIVRLTADNVFVDGDFIEKLTEQFFEKNVDYLGTSSPLDRLPYGLSGEVFKVKSLRNADQKATSAFDREHVTPWIKRNYNIALFDIKDVPTLWSNLRCTIDNFDDYLKIIDVFLNVKDPVHVSWRDLVTNLTDLSSEITSRIPFKVMSDGRIHSELVLGTAQLGMSYGVANASGMPTEKLSRELLEKAIDAGVTGLDTARAYGQSEHRIGRLLSPVYRERVSLITKLDILSELPDQASPALITKLVDESIFHSCYNLHSDSLDTLLLHRWDQYKKHDGLIWQRLIAHKTSGIICRLGVSVYEPKEAIEALRDLNVSHIQIPINILDWRWRDKAFISVVEGRPDVVWHARSVLLQGLLLLPSIRWPKVPDVNAQSILEVLDGFVSKYKRVNRADLCIAYVRSIPWVTSLVVGMEDTHQLLNNLHYFNQPKLTLEQKFAIDSLMPSVSKDLLNPAMWKNHQ